MAKGSFQVGNSKPVIDLDHYSARYAKDWERMFDEIHARCPVAWSEAYGGFWVLGDYDAVKRAAQEWETFSSFNAASGPDAPQGILIPPVPYKMALNESDPPEATKLRMLEAPWFTPKSVNKAGELARRYTREAIAAVRAKGGGDIVHDIAMPVPARTTLALVGIADEQWEDFALPAHKSAYMASDSPEFPHAALADLVVRLRALVDERSVDPRDDIASTLAQARVDDSPLDRNIATGMLLALVTGGFDTTTSLLAHALMWLDDHRGVWPRLLGDPKAMDNAIDEFLRAFPPIHGTARNITTETELCGQTLVPGERVLLSWAAANHDPRKFECPHEVRIDRRNAKEHQAFGGGVHRCLGAPLARVEIRMIFETMLRELPSYKIIKEGVRRYPTAGQVNGFLAMPFRVAEG